MVTDLHGLCDSSGCCKDLTNGVSVVIFTGSCYAEQMRSVTCRVTKERCTEQNQDPHSSLCCFPEMLWSGSGFSSLCWCAGVHGLVRWIGCKILARLEIVVRKKSPDNFRMHKIFGTLK